MKSLFTQAGVVFALYPAGLAGLVMEEYDLVPIGSSNIKVSYECKKIDRQPIHTVIPLSAPQMQVSEEFRVELGPWELQLLQKQNLGMTLRVELPAGEVSYDPAFLQVRLQDAQGHVIAQARPGKLAFTCIIPITDEDQKFYMEFAAMDQNKKNVPPPFTMQFGELQISQA